jgi:hypothetical protein
VEAPRALEPGEAAAVPAGVVVCSADGAILISRAVMEAPTGEPVEIGAQALRTHLWETTLAEREESR